MRWQVLVIALAIGCGTGHERPRGPLGTPGACDSRQDCATRCANGETLACDDLVARVGHDPEGPRYGARAVALYQVACEHGSPNGCLSAAMLLERGVGIEADAVRAQPLFDRARTGFAAQCRGGFARGCYFEAHMYRRGLGGAQDDSHARALAEQGCHRGGGLACLLFWRMRARDGDASADVHANAVDRLDADCDGGDIDACDALGNDRSRLGPSSPAPATSSAEQTSELAPSLPGFQCSAISPELCEQLTDFLVATAAGLVAAGVLDELSVALDRGACERGNEPGCYRLAMAEIGGFGMTPDVPSGLARIEATCTVGEALACDAYARAIASGLVSGRSPSDAAAYQNRACELGNLEACFRLGLEMFDGVGSFERHGDGEHENEGDVRRGLALIERACDLDLAAACAHLGRIYFNGWRSATDRARGLRLFRVACLTGGRDECDAEQAHRGQ